MRGLRFNKTVLFLVPFLAVLLAVTSLTKGVAHAQQAPSPGTLNCVVLDEFINEDLPFCDLSLNKEVSVNGGAFVDANAVGDAASAYMGDQVVWRITVSNSGASTPTGLGSVTVNDVLPTEVTYVSSTGSDGSSFNTSLNQWIFPLASIISSSSVTLNITTQASSVGPAENVATIAFRDPGSCDGNRCAYSDNNPDNDTENAWVNVSAKPVVLAETTTTPQVLALVNTGSGAVESIIAGLLIVTTLGVMVYSRASRAKSVL